MSTAILGLFLFIVVALAGCTESAAAIPDTDRYWINDARIVARAASDGKRAIAIGDRPGQAKAQGDIYDTCKFAKNRPGAITDDARRAQRSVLDACALFGY